MDHVDDDHDDNDSDGDDDGDDDDNDLTGRRTFTTATVRLSQERPRRPARCSPNHHRHNHHP